MQTKYSTTKWLKIIGLLTICFGYSEETNGQKLYFPPINNNAFWDTLSPASLGWCTDQIDELYNFLERENTKAFIVLKSGKIVLEKYFESFTKDSLWYWASAGKSLTAFLIGKAQEENYLSIKKTTSSYLGNGWTNCSPIQENAITVRHQITMTTGLDDAVPDNHCTQDTCLLFKADAGTRWAYHNAPYTLLEKVIENATGQKINAYTQSKVKNQTGMTGSWLTVDNDNVFFSKARSMARYGLLISSKGIWDKDTLLRDQKYFHDMVNTSQNLNNSYGYLWWLNGKSSYMVPTLQIVIPGSYAPHAPNDMFAALGKNGQILSISPGSDLVIVRMGNAPSSPSAEIATQLCDQIWIHLNNILCNSSSILESAQNPSLKIFPNPATENLYLSIDPDAVELTDGDGKIINVPLKGNCLDLGKLNQGIYFLRVQFKGKYYIQKVCKM